MVFFNVNGRTVRFYQAYMKVNEALVLGRRPLRSNIIFSIILLTEAMIVLMSQIHPLANCLPAEHQNAHNERILATVFGMLVQIGVWVYKRSMVPLIESTTEDSSLIEEPEEQKIIERHNRPGPFLFYGSAAYALFFVFFRDIPSTPVFDKFILMNRRERCECPDDEIWLNLLPILSLISLVFAMHTFLVTLMSFWNFAMHLSAQYKILKREFKKSLLIRDKKISRKEFRRLVDRHNHLFDLSRHLEDSFAFVAAIHIFLLQFCFCLQTFGLVIGVDVFSMTTIFRLLLCLIQIVPIAMYYYGGDYLTACSEEIGDVFTQCNWYDLSKESITDFSIVIARCQKPVKLTVAKMYKLNLWNLKYVFNALYSYMTCIAAVVTATRQ